MNSILWIAVALLGLGLVWVVSIRARYYDRALGRRAYRDGLALNTRWSRAMQDGWTTEWTETRVARLGYRRGRR